MKRKSHRHGEGSEHSNPAMAEETTEKGRDVDEKKARYPEGDDTEVVARACKEILCDSADQIAEPRVPANRYAILRDSDSRTKTRPLDDFSQLHVIQDFHRKTAVRPAGFVRGAFHHLERADSHVEVRMRIADPVGIRGDLKYKTKKCNEQLLPETNDFDVTEERQVVQIVLRCQGDGPAKDVGFEADISIGEEQPIAGGDFVGFLEGVWFPKPAGRQFRNMHDAEPRMRSGIIVENASGRIIRTVVHRDNFEIRIINFHQRGESRGKFFLLIARGKRFALLGRGNRTRG